MNKAVLLRELFNKDGIIRIVGAHNGLSAKLVERNGFDGVWASGFEISTSYAVPDANILSMSQLLEAATAINDAVSIPVVADCDTGFGNVNNVIYMVKKYEAAGIAAVCIEDKKFPKVNSYIPGRQELAPISEFVGKIVAAKNAQQSKDFMVIARVEAFIAGWGLEEALKRGKAYAEAGADAILIHSKAKTPHEIVEFARCWERATPLVVVPTTYPMVTVDELENIGIKMVIYANHGIRASIKAVNEVLCEIYQKGALQSVDPKIASMGEVFEIQGMTQMKQEEQKYLRTGTEVPKVIIPAAGAPRHQESLEKLLVDRPVAMLDINGKSILEWNVQTLRSLGISDINVIVGYKAESVQLDGINLIYNNEYQNKHILHSIMLAEDKFEERTLFIYSDIIFERSILERLLKCESDIVLVIDSSYKRTNYRSRKLDLVVTKYPPPLGNRVVTHDRENPILEIGQKIGDAKATHEFIGIALFSENGVKKLKEIYQKAKEKHKSGQFHEAPSFDMASFTDLLQELIEQGHPVHGLEVVSGWMEIHTLENYKQACQLFNTIKPEIRKSQYDKTTRVFA